MRRTLRYCKRQERGLPRDGPRYQPWRSGFQHAMTAPTRSTLRRSVRQYPSEPRAVDLGSGASSRGPHALPSPSTSTPRALRASLPCLSATARQPSSGRPPVARPSWSSDCGCHDAFVHPPEKRNFKRLGASTPVHPRSTSSRAEAPRRPVEPIHVRGIGAGGAVVTRGPAMRRRVGSAWA